MSREAVHNGWCGATGRAHKHTRLTQTNRMQVLNSVPVSISVIAGAEGSVCIGPWLFVRCMVHCCGSRASFFFFFLYERQAALHARMLA